MQRLSFTRGVAFTLAGILDKYHKNIGPVLENWARYLFLILCLHNIFRMENIRLFLELSQIVGISDNPLQTSGLTYEFISKLNVIGALQIDVQILYV